MAFFQSAVGVLQTLVKGLCDIMTFLNDGGISIDGGYIGDCYDMAFRALKNCVYKCLGIKDLHVNDGEDYKEYRDENGIVCDYEINGKMWTTEGLYNAIITIWMSLKMWKMASRKFVQPFTDDKTKSLKICHRKYRSIRL